MFKELYPSYTGHRRMVFLDYRKQPIILREVDGNKELVALGVKGEGILLDKDMAENIVEQLQAFIQTGKLK